MVYRDFIDETPDWLMSIVIPLFKLVINKSVLFCMFSCSYLTRFCDGYIMSYKTIHVIHWKKVDFTRNQTRSSVLLSYLPLTLQQWCRKLLCAMSVLTLFKPEPMYCFRMNSKLKIV